MTVTRWWIKPLFWLCATALVVFNAWWAWRDTRPLADTRTINGWVRAGRFDQAEAALREQIRRKPNLGGPRIALAKALATHGDLIGCARELHKVPFWWPEKAEVRYREGNAWLLADRARDAEAAWLAVIHSDPLHPAPPSLFHDATFELLKLYATEDRWEDAHPVIWRAYDEPNTSPDDQTTLLTWRMRSQLERVAPAEALPRLQRYVAADPGDVEALRSLARAEQGVGRRADSERHFLACLKLKPNDPRVWRDYLTMLHEASDRGPFFAALARVPRAAESEPVVWYYRGEEREKAGDIEGAAENFRQAVARNPFVLEYHYRLGRVNDRLGRHAEAVEHREKARRIREARESLPASYAAYFDVRSRPDVKPAVLSATIERLVAICRSLGFARAADAWERMTDALL